MKQKMVMCKVAFMFFLGLMGGGILGTLILGREKGVLYYQIGIPLCILLAAIAFYFYSKEKRYKKIIYLKENWPNEVETKRDFNKVVKFFKEISVDFYGEKIGYTIDDQTANDLDLNDVYKKIDSTITTAGEHMLYHILRTPKLKREELKSRDEIIELFQSDNSIREEIQVNLTNLGKQGNGDIINLFNSTTKVDKMKKYVYSFLALLPIVAGASYFIIGSKAILYIIISFTVNTFIHHKSTSEIVDEVDSIAYLGNLISISKNLCKIKNQQLEDKIKNINDNLKYCNTIDKKAIFLSSTEGVDILMDYVNSIFLTKIRAYYSIIEIIQKNREHLIEVYSTLGELDALIAVAAYRERVKRYCKPNFVDNDQYISIVDGIHPLIDEPIANSIALDKKGIILTGSNMSGKSTFLRTVGINILLAQTIYTVCAKEYKGSYFKLLTSLSITDDVNSGKSYYLGEAEALLRILNSLEGNITTFCMIDEIFRGTNPIERVASSTEIIRYIMDRNALALIATHDLELTEVAKDKYECYYFSELVDEKEGLKFDYLMKKGVSPTRNAIKLLKFIGYPEEIIEGANERVTMALKSE